MHSTLVGTPEGLPLGLLTQKIWARASDSQQNARERKNTAIEQKESYRWIEALQETVARAPVSSQVVTLCDRGADIYEVLAEAQQLEAKLVLRAAWDRHLEHDDFPRLWPLLDGQAVAGYLTIDLPAREKRQQRKARLVLRFTAVTLDPPQRHRAAVPEPLPSLALYAGQVKEVEPPPEEPALEWMLLTNSAVHTGEEALPRVEWYRSRWLVEEFHKILKSGCRVEGCRLQTAPRLIRYVTLCRVIAWRPYWLTHVNRTVPTAPATTILAPEEVAALQALSSGALPPTNSPLTTREAVRLIAKLGASSVGGMMANRGSRSFGAGGNVSLTWLSCGHSFLRVNLWVKARAKPGDYPFYLGIRSFFYHNSHLRPEDDTLRAKSFIMTR